MNQSQLYKSLAGLLTLGILLLLGGCGGGGGSTAAGPVSSTNPPAVINQVTLDPIQDVTQGGSAGASYSAGVAINDNNQVIGFAETGTGSEFHAALWSVASDGTLNAAPTNLKPIVGNAFSAAFGIDGHGNVVGQSSDGARLVAVIWKVGAIGPERLPALTGGASSCALAINAAGSLIVGESQDTTFTTRAVVWPVTNGLVGTPALLGDDLSNNAALGSYSSARGVNDNNWIVGVSEDTNEQDHAVLWRPDGAGHYVLTDLASGGEEGSDAVAINLAGQVVGTAEPNPGVFVPVLWSENDQGKFTRTELASSGGGAAINNSGRIAGWESTLPLATVWSASTAGKTNLYPTASQAYGLNNNNLVVGTRGEAGFVLLTN
jgi:uncharacterized membrane protein